MYKHVPGFSTPNVDHAQVVKSYCVDGLSRDQVRSRYRIEKEQLGNILVAACKGELGNDSRSQVYEYTIRNKILRTRVTIKQLFDVYFGYPFATWKDVAGLFEISETAARKYFSDMNKTFPEIKEMITAKDEKEKQWKADLQARTCLGNIEIKQLGRLFYLGKSFSDVSGSYGVQLFSIHQGIELIKKGPVGEVYTKIFNERFPEHGKPIQYSAWKEYSGKTPLYILYSQGYTPTPVDQMRSGQASQPSSLASTQTRSVRTSEHVSLPLRVSRPTKRRREEESEEPASLTFMEGDLGEPELPQSLEWMASPATEAIDTTVTQTVALPAVEHLPDVNAVDTWVDSLFN